MRFLYKLKSYKTSFDAIASGRVGGSLRVGASADGHLNYDEIVFI
jgi:hypothetical protein